MTKHFFREVERLKKEILVLSAMVEETLHQAVTAVVERNVVLAEKVIDNDNQIDKFEVDIEEDCLKVLALHQPVAIDLRFIVAVLKMNNDLERIGDLAANIASRGKSIAQAKKIAPPFDFDHMGGLVKSMLRKCLEALVNLDSKLAREVLQSDDEIDEMYRQVYRTVHERIKKDPEEVESLVHYLSASRNLERIGDHVTNIAEDVIYMAEGEIVRHGRA